MSDAIGGISEQDLSDLLSLCPRLYAAVGWDEKKRPDWELFRNCFHPDAVLAPLSSGSASAVPVEAFIQAMQGQISGGELKSFSERELSHHIEAFGNIANVRSSFAAAMNGVERKGVTFAQMVRHAGRWLIWSAIWDNESADAAVPANLT